MPKANESKTAGATPATIRPRKWTTQVNIVLGLFVAIALVLALIIGFWIKARHPGEPLPEERQPAEAQP